MLRYGLTCALLMAAASPAAAADLLVKNESKYTLNELYVSASKSKKWGDDQLRDANIAPGSEFTLRNIPDGVYDLKFVDEDDDSCVVSDISFAQGKVWTVTNEVVENCEGDDDE